MNIYTKLARTAINKYLSDGVVIKPDSNLPHELLHKKAGVFVSLHLKNPINIDEDLRGCIGTIKARYDCIAQEIIENAIYAATSDNRFKPLKLSELKNINISVDILDKPEYVQGLSSLDPCKYGVIVKSEDGRTGLLLPKIDGIDNAEIQIAIARDKANIGPFEEIYIYRFETTRYIEDESKEV